MKPSHPKITVGVFDSGVGGLSILGALWQQMPQARLIYFADSAHAPYGERGDAYVIDRSRRIAQHLLHCGAQLIVVACNTATAAAIDALRQQWPTVPLVGVEPGIKPAVAASRNGRVGVLATAGTLGSERFARLSSRHAGQTQVITQSCPGLAAKIEEGHLQATDLRQMVENYCAPLKEAGIDTLVLGCTHYPFIRPLIAECFAPDLLIIDTAQAVARQALNQTSHRLPAAPAPRESTPPLLLTSGRAEKLRHIARAWLGFEVEVESVPDV